MINAPPGIIFILGALLVPFLRGNIRKAYLLLLPLVAFVDLLYMPHGTNYVFNFIGLDLIFARVDSLSMVFAYVFVIIAFIGNLYAIHVKESWQHMTALIYAGSALGVVFAGDLFSLFIFWEIMAIASALLIWSRKTKASLNAGFRYILVHIFGGVCLLAGIALHFSNTGSILFGNIGLDGLDTYLIFLGFIINAAVPPLHAWLVDAYPESTITGTVFLSAFTTKTAVYVLARSFPGTEILIIIGALMTVYPIFYAVLENDIRKVLGYSLINQVGFMITGIGIGTALSINGTVSHAFCHIIYKALLFMSMGSVIYMTGKDKFTDLGGLYKTMPLTLIFCMIGAASISAFPLFSGFISKSMIVTASAEGGMLLTWFLLLFASAGVFHHAGIKVPYFTFFAHDSGIRAKEPPLNMLLAMGIAAFLCIFIGIYPDILYNILPYPVDFIPYTTPHVVSQLQLLFFAGLAFLFLITYGYYPPEQRAINLDTDWFYRKGAKWFTWFINNPLSEFSRLTAQATLNFFLFLLWFSRNPLAALKILLNIEKNREKYPNIPQYLEVVNLNAILTLIFLSICILVFLLK